jgi:arginine N-succinyltransferase
MPHYPVYVPLLPGEAQAVMGQIHPSGELAFGLLTAEGFEADDYIDIFDGGPILQAHKHALRTFTQSMQCRATLYKPSRAGEPVVQYAVAANAGQQFRAVIVSVPAIEGGISVALPQEVLDVLQVAEGGNVICVRI